MTEVEVANASNKEGHPTWEPYAEAHVFSMWYGIPFLT